jgi:hypothetical protein
VQYEKALKDAGVDCEFITVPGAKHAADGFFTPEVTTRVEAFFVKYLQAGKTGQTDNQAASSAQTGKSGQPDFQSASSAQAGNARHPDNQSAPPSQAGKAGQLDNQGALSAQAGNAGQPVYRDVPFTQDYSVRYYLPESLRDRTLKAVSADRDGHIRILSDREIIVPDNGSLFYPGQFVPDVSYSPVLARQINSIKTYRNQTFYLDNHQLFSNAWAGKIQIDHGLPGASIFEGGEDFRFLISDGEKMVYVDKTGKSLWSGAVKGVCDIRYHPEKKTFIIATAQAIFEFTPESGTKELYKGTGITCAIPFKNDVVAGTQTGYLFLSKKQLIKNVPCAHITNISEINGKLWFATVNGIFGLNEDGKYAYYAGERWLPCNATLTVEAGPDNSLLVLTKSGLGQIYFEKMTLEDKAMFYEKMVRQKNIRYGFNSSSGRLVHGYSSSQTGVQPSDNLWTSMYLVSQLFRYKATGALDALENAYESFEAMERLFTVTGIRGLFARSIERDYIVENTKTPGWEQREYQSGSPATIWSHAADFPNWTWRATVSSDQTVGQMFALTWIIALVDDQEWKNRAITCLDNLMGYIVENDLYIIDIDGKPTLWGKWNPDYVNAFPVNVGDRRLYSSNITAFLQAAYQITGKEKYKAKALELLDKYGYLENLTRPISVISPTDADEFSRILSRSWNHSDDEMYFLAYHQLVNYALTPELKEKYIAGIKDHWEVERPERNALWNFTYAMSTGAGDFDMDESIWFLKTYPLDLRSWGMKNSHRDDIELLPPNFRQQTLPELLPLGEMPLYRHNGEIFRLDSNGDGSSMISAGDVWLLPYWMGRYAGLISASEK